ncbi:Ger(x)C family spore germination protein [Tumebacillus sp. ITR2]|uniref:Ger(X)C family spore germination protein n=1 Tax=Tumebacillus amylolyticus TaxID=2801339 RepID=A0ABS1JGX8_9BACL|nr:Ger(x)C family spore germination protein [Tumebacillus amylolyticus]MBL0389495.1 Ger(x)C family spore germination protein [Tumebacillus amylolyticus]
MKKTFTILLILSLSVLPLAGCWDHTEMNDLALVMASAYDWTPDGKLRVTLQIANPEKISSKGSSSDSGDKKFITQTMTGRTIHDAFIKIQERLSRRLYEGHRRVILIGESMAKHGIEQLLDEFSRDPDSRFRSYILVCKGTEAGQLLSSAYPLERVPSEAIRELEKSDVGYESTIRDCLLHTIQEGIEPVMGTLEINVPEGKEDQTFHLTGTAVFQDWKLIGYLDDKETRALLWANGKRSKGMVTSYIPEAQGYVSIEMRKEKSKIKTEVVGNKVRLHVIIDCEAMVHENDTNLDFSKPENLTLAERQISTSIEKRVTNLLRKTQDFHQDIVGFGRQLHRDDRKQWERFQDKWSDAYTKADPQVEVRLRLSQLGLTREPLHKTKERK